MVLVSSGGSDIPVPSADGRSDFSADVGVYRRAQADAETARSTAVTLSMRGAHQGPFHVAPFGGVVLALWAKYGKRQQATPTEGAAAQTAAQQGEERVTVSKRIESWFGSTIETNSVVMERGRGGQRG